MAISDLDRLASDISLAVFHAPEKTRQIVTRGAVNIKGDWRKAWSQRPTIRHLPPSIGFDIGSRRNFTVEATIGPDKAKPQSAIAHIIEFGSPTSAPIPGGVPALAAEEPRFVSELEKLALGLLDRR